MWVQMDQLDRTPASCHSCLSSFEANSRAFDVESFQETEIFRGLGRAGVPERQEDLCERPERVAAVASPRDDR